MGAGERSVRGLMGRLDTCSRALYKHRPFWVAGLLLLGLPAAAELVLGAQLPDNAQKVGENRYRASQDYEETLKYYKSVYPPDRFPRKSIVHQPGVKAVHIANPGGKQFEGLNIYEANEEVRIYVVPAGETAKQAPKKKDTKPAKKK
jgi:hypothetical protein